MADRRRIVVTGACGKIAGQLLPALESRYDVVKLDVRNTRGGNSSLTLGPGEEATPQEVLPDVHICDLLEEDRSTLSRLFQGVDTVVHCGFAQPPPAPAQPLNSGGGTDMAEAGAVFGAEAMFTAEHNNVRMAFNIFQTAVEQGVARVVMASSNHAADFYEDKILRGEHDTVDPDGRALSDNYYGWAKIAYENLGFMFACGKTQRELSNIMIRIGGPRETDVGASPLGDLVTMRRALGAYISERDMQQLFVKSIECDVDGIRDRFGVPFQIFYGVSGNDHGFWSLANARRVIGYAPQDNSAIRFADDIAQHVAAHTAKL